MTLPICRDCRWCRYPEKATGPCMHDIASQRPVNLITGADDPALIYCSTMRDPRGPCGIEGRLFEGRDAA